MNMLSWLDSVRADAVFGWRQLMKNKATTAAAVLSLALGTGACVAAFRLMDALLFRPLPVAGADRLYSVAFENVGAAGKLMVYDSCSYPMFQRMREAVKEDADLIAASYADHVDLTFGSDEEMEKANLQYVSGWMFSSFGLNPALGRLLNAGDDAAPGAHPLAVISHAYWSRRFGRDRGVIGRKVRIGDDLIEIVGVTGENFEGTETGTQTDIFLPMAMKNPRTLASPVNFWLRTLVKLKPGVRPDPVREKLRAAFAAIQLERATGFMGMPKRQLEAFLKERLLLEPAAAGRSNLQRDYRRPLAALGSLAAMVLLIACANVANLMTARAAARGREMALRVSIGAGRARLAQLVMVEGAWVAMLATGLGALFAWQVAPWLVSMINPPGDPAHLAMPADSRVVGFAIVLGVSITLLFGMAPAWRASSVKPATALRGGEDPRSRSRMMRVSIAAQVAFCFVVVLAAGLFVETFDRLSNQPLGFSPERVLNLETTSRKGQPGMIWSQALERLRAMPGVEAAGLTGWPAMSGETSISLVSINGGVPSESYCDLVYASPGWLGTMRIPLIDGRDFRDGEANPAVIVNQAFAREYFRGENPVGKFFELVGRGRVMIVGLTGDARSRDDLRLPIRATAYVTFDSVGPRSRGTFVVQTANSNPVALASILRREVSRARPELRVTNVRTQIEVDRSKMVRERMLAMLALFFAGVALMLAGIGLYGVLDYAVLDRRREIGIRLAIGATAGDIGRRVTIDIFAIVLAGAGAGLMLGIALVRSIEALLYQVKATDLALLSIPAGAIVVVACIAALAPVTRAVRIDPVTILRAE